MTAIYGKMYAHSGYREATGELAPDWDAPRNWDAPYWKDRADQAIIHAGDLVRARTPDRQTADAVLIQFWAAFPDAWMDEQPWRYLALSAEALRNYLLRLPAGQPPEVTTMIEVYRTRNANAGSAPH